MFLLIQIVILNVNNGGNEDVRDIILKNIHNR